MEPRIIFQKRMQNVTVRPAYHHHVLHTSAGFYDAKRSQRHGYRQVSSPD